MVDKQTNFSWAHETNLVGFVRNVKRNSRHLGYTEAHSGIISSVRRFIDHVENVILFPCFCPDGELGALDQLMISVSLPETIERIPIYSFDVLECHSCMGLALAREMYTSGEIDIDYLLQFCAHMYRHLKSCDCKNYKKTSCKKCQLRQFMEKVDVNHKGLSVSIDLPERLFDEMKIFELGSSIDDYHETFTSMDDFIYFSG